MLCRMSGVDDPTVTYELFLSFTYSGRNSAERTCLIDYLFFFLPPDTTSVHSLDMLPPPLLLLPCLVALATLPSPLDRLSFRPLPASTLCCCAAGCCACLTSDVGVAAVCTVCDGAALDGCACLPADSCLDAEMDGGDEMDTGEADDGAACMNGC